MSIPAGGCAFVCFDALRKQLGGCRGAVEKDPRAVWQVQVYGEQAGAAKARAVAKDPRH